jgi:hypothetical protein
MKTDGENGHAALHLLLMIRPVLDLKEDADDTKYILLIHILRGLWSYCVMKGMR